MKDYVILKNDAIKLRKKGLSYGEIKKRLLVSKSTLSLWLKDVQLTEEQKKKFYTKNIINLSKGPQSQKERRIREINEIINTSKKEISNRLSLESYKLFGTALYWAEGSKTGKFEITNSDPYLILFMVNWFDKVFDVKPNNLKAWLNIYPQQDDKEIKKFWSELTGIPLDNFGKSFIKPANKNYRKNNLYYGTIKVMVRKGMNMKHKTYGWLRAVLKDISQKTNLAQKEWKSLRDNSRPINI